MTARHAPEVTAFDQAVALRQNVKGVEWQIGALLLEAERCEGRTIREYALAVDRNYDREDTYSNWKRANQFKERGYPESLNVLPIGYFADAMTALDDGIDVEDIIEKLLWCAYENGHLRARFVGIRSFQAWRAEVTGKSKPIERVERELEKVIRNTLPMWAGRKDSMNISESFRASMIAKFAAALLYWLRMPVTANDKLEAPKDAAMFEAER
jgi:hypothetical protein